MAYAELSTLKLAKYPVKFLLLFMPCMRIVIEYARISFTANDNFESAFWVVQLALDFELGALLGPLVGSAGARLDQLFSIACPIIF